MILLIGILCLVVRTVGATCTFPVTGTFTSSHNGDVTFNSTHMEYLIGAQGGNLVFECYSTTGTKLILKSEQFPLFSSYAIAVLCMDITELKSSNLYQLQLYTSKLADANYQRVKYVTTSTTVTDAVACDDNANTETSVMMLSGSISNVIETCPTDLMGSFAYTFNDTDCLSTNGLLDICTDTSKFSFDYTACSTVQAYSANGELNCIYTTTSGTATKLYTYNLDTTTDESTYYRFTCYMFEVTSSGTINATQHPQDCLSTQTAYSVDSPGATIALTANFTCVPPTVTPATQIATGAVAAIAVGVIIFLIIIGLIIGYLCWRAKCRKEKVEPRKGLPPTHTGMPTFVTHHKDTAKPNGYSGYHRERTDSTGISDSRANLILTPSTLHPNYISKHDALEIPVPTDAKKSMLPPLNDFTLNGSQVSLLNAEETLTDRKPPSKFSKKKSKRVSKSKSKKF